MQLKTILNRVHRLGSFVYGDAVLREQDGELIIEQEIRPRANGRAVCSGCGKKAPGYDSLPVRRFEFVPLWGIAFFLLYAMRRVQCPRCGVTVETVPWADGKCRRTLAYSWFLARWAKRMSWKEVAEAFRTSWENVYRSVQWAVQYGLAHRVLDGITAIGVDEVLWHRGHHYLTVVYQLDAGAKRLLWVGKERTEATLRQFFGWLGQKRSEALRFVCSDMWKPYLTVIKEKAAQALNVLDRFHIAAKMNKAIDKVRAKEAKELKANGLEPVLTRSRWCLLKRPENLTDGQETKLSDLLRYNLRTVRAYLLKEEFQFFWSYVRPGWAGRFLERWCTKAMRSRIEPMKEIARSLRTHRPLIMNWFRAREQISLGAVEGLNNKLKVVTRKSYGFRTFEATETALYHGLGDLPEPPVTHRFC
jgi:transposase